MASMVLNHLERAAQIEEEPDDSAAEEDENDDSSEARGEEGQDRVSREGAEAGYGGRD